MPRHVFIVRSDIRLLEVDARLAVTDEAGNNPSDWLAGHPDQGAAEARLHGLHAGQVVRVARGPDVWVAAVPPGGVTSPQSSADACTRFVGQAANAIGSGGRRLLAVPALGTGASVRQGVDTAVIEAVLRAAAAAAHTYDVDIAYVAYGGDDAGGRVYSAAQAARRRPASSEPGWWAALDPALADHADRLARLARAGRLVLFTGAGISVPAGLPM